MSSKETSEKLDALLDRLNAVWSLTEEIYGKVVGQRQQKTLVALRRRYASFELEVQVQGPKGPQIRPFEVDHPFDLDLLAYALCKWRLRKSNPASFIVVSVWEFGLIDEERRRHLLDLERKKNSADLDRLRESWMLTYRRQCSQLNRRARTLLFSGSDLHGKNERGRQRFVWSLADLDSLVQRGKMEDVQCLVERGDVIDPRACGYNWKALQSLSQRGVSVLGYCEDLEERLGEITEVCAWILKQEEDRKLRRDVEQAQDMFEQASRVVKRLREPPPPAWEQVASNIVDVARVLGLSESATNFINTPGLRADYDQKKDPRMVKREFVDSVLQGEDGTKVWQDVLDCLDNGSSFCDDPPSVRRVKQLQRLKKVGGESKWNGLVTFLTWAIYAETSEPEESEWRYVEEALSGVHFILSGVSPKQQLAGFALAIRKDIQSGQRGLADIADLLRSQSSQQTTYQGLLEQSPSCFGAGYMRKIAPIGSPKRLEDHLRDVFFSLTEQDVANCDDMVQFFQLYEGKLLEGLIEPSLSLSSGDYEHLEPIGPGYEIDVVRNWIDARQKLQKRLPHEIVDRDKLESTAYKDFADQLKDMQRTKTLTLGALLADLDIMRQGSGGRGQR